MYICTSLGTDLRYKTELCFYQISTRAHFWAAITFSLHKLKLKTECSLFCTYCTVLAITGCIRVNVANVVDVWTLLRTCDLAVLHAYPPLCGTKLGFQILQMYYVT